MGELQEVKIVKGYKKIKILVPMLFLLLCISLFAGYYFYSHQIVKIKDVNVIIKQSQKYQLPDSIPVILRNNSSKLAKVQWIENKIDTNKTFDYDIKGKVSGYEKNAIIHVHVYPYVVEGGNVSEKIIQGDKYTLPDKVMVHLSNFAGAELKVKWDSNNIDTNKLGKYTVQGTTVKESSNDKVFIDKKIECNLNLEILSKDDVVNSLFVENNYTDTPEVKAAINVVKSLPIKILYLLYKNNIKIVFVDKTNYSAPDGSESGGYYGNTQIVVKDVKDYYYQTRIWNEGNDYIFTLHEIGHAFDLNCMSHGNLSDSDEFKKIINEEGTKVFNTDFSTDNKYRNYFLDSPMEYFAECFAFYFGSDSRRKMLQEKAPLTYQFIEKSVNNFNYTISN